ncbi:MAG: DUF429 domain-containing protein [Gemmatimonadales bacterium]
MLGSTSVKPKGQDTEGDPATLGTCPIFNRHGCPIFNRQLHERADGVSAMVFPSIADALDRFKPTLLMVDIPIGLTDAGPRDCDVAARGLLRPKRSSSVFRAPIRAVLGGETYAEANSTHRATDGCGLSAQAFAIVPKIREVDDLIAGSPGLQAVVREVHPEVCFAHWNNGVPMAHAKRRPEGRSEREALIDAYWPGIRDRLAGQIGGTAWADDDLNDALAALWTARRVHIGSAARLPETPPADRLGLRMEMWA